MKTLICTFLALCLSLCVANAQGMKPFDPAKFQADLEQFITVEACLTPSEAAAFFPLYREMTRKQRALYEQMREDRRVNPDSEEAAKQGKPITMPALLASSRHANFIKSSKQRGNSTEWP